MEKIPKDHTQRYFCIEIQNYHCTKQTVQKQNQENFGILKDNK